MKDLYQILEIKETATYDEIKKAYRKLAKKYHPDITKNDEKSRERFEEISQAYEILGNEEKRKQFDKARKATRENSSQKTNSSQNFSDFQSQRKVKLSHEMKPEDFSNLFGQYFGFQSKTAKKTDDVKAFQTDELFHSFFKPKKKS